MNSLAPYDTNRGLALSDPAITSTLEKLKDGKRRLERLDKEVNKALAIHVGPGRKLVAFIGRFVPGKLGKQMAEQVEPLFALEHIFRTYINDVQGTLLGLKQVAYQKNEEINELQVDLQKARREGWGARQLRDYIFSKAGIPIYQEVLELMDFELEQCGPEEQERRAQELLDQLANHVDLGRELVRMLGKTAVAANRLLEKGVTQYYTYTRVMYPVKQIKETAEALLGENQAMYASREVLIITLRESLTQIGNAIQAAQLAERYRIASPEMIAELNRGHQTLDTNLKQLAAGRTDPALPARTNGETENEARGDNDGQPPAAD